MTSGDDGRTWTETSAAWAHRVRESPLHGRPGARRPGAARELHRRRLLVRQQHHQARAGPAQLSGLLPQPRQRTHLAVRLHPSSYPLPQHCQCGTSGETFNDGDPNYPEAAPDGSLYVEVNCGHSTFLARSTDEGATWPLVTSPSGAPVIVPADGELRVGTNRDLFLVYQSTTSAVVLRRVHQRGAVVGAGGAAHAGRHRPDSPVGCRRAGAGLLALSYLRGKRDRRGYTTVLDLHPERARRRPFAVGGRHQPRGQPNAQRAPQARDDFIGADIGPDGTPWASFAASCPGPVNETSACSWSILQPRGQRSRRRAPGLGDT